MRQHAPLAGSLEVGGNSQMRASQLNAHLASPGSNEWPNAGTLTPLWPLGELFLSTPNINCHPQVAQLVIPTG